MTPKGRMSIDRSKAPYRLLYNNDTTNTAGVESPFHKTGEHFTEAKLVASIVEVAGKGVDCYLLSPGMGWVPWWQSKVEPDFFEWWQKRTGFTDVVGNRSGKGYETYVFDGGDMVRVLVETCRKLDMAPFVTFRLNDVHAQEHYNEKSQRSIVSSRFYCEHPEWHLDPKHSEANPQGYYGKRGMDWALPAVRAYKLALLRELAENYDLAGIELDFLRHSELFRDKGPLPEERIRIMTQFVSDVRKAMDGEKGKRQWLGVRIPIALSAHPALGLDVQKLHAAGVDMFNLSPWYSTSQRTDLAEVRKLLPGAAVYLEMTHSAGSNPYFAPKSKSGYGTMPNPRTSDNQFYTTARLAYARGADGISLFNFVYYRMYAKGIVDYREPPFHVLPHLTDRSFLDRQPPYYWLGQTSYLGQVPCDLTHGRSRTFKMDMLPADPTVTLRLRVHSNKEIGSRPLVVTFNGTPLKAAADVSPFYDDPFDRMITPDDTYRRAWMLPAALLRNGQNEITLTLESGDPMSVIWIDAGI